MRICVQMWEKSVQASTFWFFVSGTLYAEDLGKIHISQLSIFSFEKGGLSFEEEELARGSPYQCLWRRADYQLSASVPLKKKSWLLALSMSELEKSWLLVIGISCFGKSLFQEEEGTAEGILSHASSFSDLRSVHWKKTATKRCWSLMSWSKHVIMILHSLLCCKIV